jgi:hypothetical protein
MSAAATPTPFCAQAGVPLKVLVGAGAVGDKLGNVGDFAVVALGVLLAALVADLASHQTVCALPVVRVPPLVVRLVACAPTERERERERERREQLCKELDALSQNGRGDAQARMWKFEKSIHTMTPTWPLSGVPRVPERCERHNSYYHISPSELVP